MHMELARLILSRKMNQLQKEIYVKNFLNSYKKVKRGDKSQRVKLFMMGQLLENGLLR